ncbi:MAG: rhomboid family intramembrane serine protease [Desulfonatronovibrio sp.]
MSENFRDILDDIKVPGLHSPDKQKITEWELVLTAMGVDYSRGRNGELFVPVSQTVKAVDEIRLYEEEEKRLPARIPASEQKQENVFASLLVLSLLLLFFVVVYENPGSSGLADLPWLEKGRMDAGKILDGEIWRAVTALTLHSDPAHVLGNVIIGAPFIIMVCSGLGMGLGWLLVIVSGAMANYINALVVAPTHLSIGFSTSVFAAVGIMSVNSIRHSRLSLSSAFVLGLALLALLGVGGKNTDLGAHLFGFLAGFVMGWIALMLIDTMENIKKVDFLFGLSAFLLVLESWFIALSGKSFYHVIF